jgi:hypothetical protein
MLNLAGREYDFGPVLFAVLQECEHRRRSLPPDDAEAAAKLAEIARQKLAEIEPCYREAGGVPAYWRELASEVLDTALPQYARAAAAQTRLEQASYGLWRQGDPVSRLVLGLAGLTAGGLIVKAPFIPIFENAFAFALAAAAFLYPEIKRLVYDWRYSRLLNRLVAQAESYQHRQLPYISEAVLEAELRAVDPAAGNGAAAASGAAPAADATGAAIASVPRAASAASGTTATIPGAAAPDVPAALGSAASTSAPAGGAADEMSGAGGDHGRTAARGRQ